jgi:hypothetical protein
MTYTNENIIDTIIEKFQNVTGLGKDEDNTGTYSHQDSKSGIGCAIGCLLEPEKAEKLQALAEENSKYSIRRLLLYAKTEKGKNFLPLLESIAHLDMDLLKEIQVLHDDSNTVEEFLQELRMFKRSLNVQ